MPTSLIFRYGSLAALTIALASVAEPAGAVDCSIPAQRDATCAGDGHASEPNRAGLNDLDNSTLSSTLRGANARPNPPFHPEEAAAPVSEAQATASAAFNECLSVPFISWAYDPASYHTAAPSFSAQRGGGYLGSAGARSPTDSCPSDSDGSCVAWVPASHPFLYVGQNNFIQCAGPASLNSVSCSESGSRAYVTTNPGDHRGFQAHMVACRSNQIPPGMRVLNSPLAWWTSCERSPYCSFFLIYPSGGSR